VLCLFNWEKEGHRAVRTSGHFDARRKNIAPFSMRFVDSDEGGIFAESNMRRMSSSVLWKKLAQLTSQW
jgi:hypothetical protein